MPVGADLVIPKEPQAASDWVKTIHSQARIVQEIGLRKQTRRAKSQEVQYNKSKKKKNI